jgi:hypothetical protein
MNFIPLRFQKIALAALATILPISLFLLAFYLHPNLI